MGYFGGREAFLVTELNGAHRYVGPDCPEELSLRGRSEAIELRLTFAAAYMQTPAPATKLKEAIE